MPKDIAFRLLDWAEKEQAFEKNILGPSSKAALLGLTANEDVSSITNQAQTNGSAMRIAPIGCLFTPNQKDALINYVANISNVGTVTRYTGRLNDDDYYVLYLFN